MHIPKDVFFKDSALFRYLARNHFMHHRKSTKNYNVVCPLADYLFRTKAKPTQADIREMLRLGYLRPTSDRVQELIDRLREATEMQREQTVNV
jgi:sterol desaturase/sphingolipid hydroxylase (fatty acid hydroxylase superfamily)